MSITRLLTISSSAFFLAGCTQEENLQRLIDEAFASQGEVRVITSCTSFLGFGPAVAIFQVSSGLADEALGLTGRFSEVSAWSHHDSMDAFESGRSHERVGIAATLLDGKECLKNLTPDASAILFEKMPGAYYASPGEEVVIVLFAEPQRSGVIFVQSP